MGSGAGHDRGLADQPAPEIPAGRREAEATGGGGSVAEREGAAGRTKRRPAQTKEDKKKELNDLQEHEPLGRRLLLELVLAPLEAELVGLCGFGLGGTRGSGDRVSRETGKKVREGAS